MRCILDAEHKMWSYPSTFEHRQCDILSNARYVDIMFLWEPLEISQMKWLL
jgi:hypothetical protein